MFSESSQTVSETDSESQIWPIIELLEEGVVDVGGIVGEDTFAACDADLAEVAVEQTDRCVENVDDDCDDDDYRYDCSWNRVKLVLVAKRELDFLCVHVKV